MDTLVVIWRSPGRTNLAYNTTPVSTLDNLVDSKHKIINSVHIYKWKKIK